METGAMKVKVCGLTNRDDYVEAVRLGADYTGFIFYEKSPRYVTVEQVLEITGNEPFGTHKRVGVFVNEAVETLRDMYHRARLDIVQLHGDEDPDYVERLGLPYWKVIRVKDLSSLVIMDQYNCDTILLDTFKKELYGGTGVPFDPAIAEAATGRGKKIIVSGGISIDNIGTLMNMNTSFYAVDINSSIEQSPGKKDLMKMNEFFEAKNGTQF